jgi:transcription antitermination factor NusG
MQTNYSTAQEANADPAAYPAEDRGDWIVLHTMSRCEKTLAEELVIQDVPHFLPLQRRVRYYGRRKAIVHEPMFSSYVFLRGSLDDAYSAARTGRIANIIRVANQDQLDWELKNLWMAVTSGATLDPFPALKTGVRVEVTSGPFRGLQGTIENRTRADRLILTVEMLGRAVSMELDGALMDPLS